MRVLLTGGAGFQGSHLAECLCALGHKITVLNTPSREAEANLDPLARRIQVVWGSVTDPEIVRKTVRGQDLVVHLAALIHVDQSIQSPASFLDVNVNGTSHVLDAVREQGNRLIYGSSCEVYGAVERGSASETSELRPYNPYAASKAAADRLCFAYWKTYGIDVTIVRPCNIYGPRQKGGKHGAVIPIFVDRALAKTPPVIYGTGDQRREYMHVEDLVAAYKLVIENTDLQGQVINFGTGETPSIKEIAEFVADQLSVSVDYSSARAGEVPRFRMDSTKATELGFAPQVPFWEGLQRYVELQKSRANAGQVL